MSYPNNADTGLWASFAPSAGWWAEDGMCAAKNRQIKER